MTRYYISAPQQSQSSVSDEQGGAIQGEFSPWFSSIFRGVSVAGVSALLASGCVHVDSLQVTEPKPAPAAPVAPALPEGAHWETPIITGYERRILVRNGEHVQKGDPLVAYSNSAVRLLEIQVEQLSLLVRDSKEQFERLTTLRRSNAASEVEFEGAESALRSAQLKLEAEQIRLDAMRFVKAPFDGTVRIDSTSNSPSISVYPDGGSEVLKNFSEATVPPIEP